MARVIADAIQGWRDADHPILGVPAFHGAKRPKVRVLSACGMNRFRSGCV